MEYEIKNWPGYFLNITEHSIDVYSSWGTSKGRPMKGQKREIITIKNKRKKISQRKSKYGYVRLNLSVGKTGRKQVFLHRLIAETLIPNQNNLECVDHIDGNKLNNHPSNLQWITRGNNVRKAQDMGKWGTHPESYEIIFSDSKKIKITNINKFSRENGYQATKLVAISKGKRKSHKNIVGVIKCDECILQRKNDS